MNTKSYLVEKADAQAVRKEIEELQEKVNSVTEESTTWEVKEAYHNHSVITGYIRCMRDLKLLEEPDYSRMFIKQIRIAEKIKALQEKRLTSTANTGEPHNK